MHTSVSISSWLGLTAPGTLPSSTPSKSEHLADCAYAPNDMPSSTNKAHSWMRIQPLRAPALRVINRPMPYSIRVR